MFQAVHGVRLAVSVPSEPSSPVVTCAIRQPGGSCVTAGTNAAPPSAPSGGPSGTSTSIGEPSGSTRIGAGCPARIMTQLRETGS